MKTVCFTGHRNFENSYEFTPTHSWVSSILSEKIKDAYANGFTKFISGGAIGTDQLAAQAVIVLRNSLDITLTIAVPFAGQQLLWPVNAQKTYARILQNANDVINLDTGDASGHAAKKLFARNTWMVDQSDAVIAVYDGRQAGGTFRTINYAKEQRKQILVIDPIRGDVSWVLRQP